MLIEEGRLNIFVFKSKEGDDYKKFEERLIEYNKDKCTERGLYIDYLYLDNITSRERRMVKQLTNCLSEIYNKGLMTPIIIIISGDIDINTNIDLTRYISTMSLYHANTIFVSDEIGNGLRIFKCRELPVNTIVTLNKIFEEEEE